MCSTVSLSNITVAYVAVKEVPAGLIRFLEELIVWLVPLRLSPLLSLRLLITAAAAAAPPSPTYSCSHAPAPPLQVVRPVLLRPPASTTTRV